MYVDCVCVCLSPVFTGSVVQQYIQRVDSSRLNVSLNITHKAPPERVRGRVGGVEGMWIKQWQGSDKMVCLFSLYLYLYSQPLAKC